MKLLIVSDSHGKYGRLRDAMDMHRDADALIFLGDGLYDLWRAEAYSYPFTVFSVKGNCDGAFSPDGIRHDEELTLSLGGYKFFVLHGHTRDVKYGLDRAVYAASECDADVMLYGHTHIPHEEYLTQEDGQKPMYLFNPGSLSHSSDGKAHFGLVEIRGKSILFSHGELK